MNRSTQLHSFMISLCILSFSLLYVGCAGSDEAMTEDEMITDIGYYEEAPQEGTEDLVDTTEQVLPPAPEPVKQPEGPSRAQLQKDLDQLKTENIQLKNQLTTRDQSRNEMTAKISDLEAALLAMKKQKEEQPKPVEVKQRPAVAGKSSPESVRLYKSTVSKFNTKAYKDVISEMQTLLNTGIKDDYADNCHYWIGLSYFQLREHDTAIQHFQQVMNYRFSEKKDDAQMMIARSYERKGNKEKALQEYRKLIDMYPASEYVKRAQARMR